ncbi:MAG: 3,4-dihydroxy-2-butanone-4-phosphate synthase, partial [Pseudobdellovibrio sp.]
MHISSTDEILKDFKSGHFVILIDDKDRENEGDLMIAADFISADKINFMTKQASGLLYLALSQIQVQKLKLPLMKSKEHSSAIHHAAFTYSIEARSGITTGISATDRAHTIKTAIKSEATHESIVCPGHVFPICAKAGGVLERAGHTEAAVDLAILSNLSPATVACEILNELGDAATGATLSDFAKNFNIKIGTVADLIEYRKSVN